MDKLASSVFRKYFAKLDAPTQVTVNGHTIGVWVPAAPGVSIEWASDLPTQQYDDMSAFVPPPPPKVTIRTPQAERDAILRRVNIKRG